MLTRGCVLPLTQVGDLEYTKFLDSTLNSRRIIYLGSGVRDNASEAGWNYGIGDAVPQIPPTCGESMPGRSEAHTLGLAACLVVEFE